MNRKKKTALEPKTGCERDQLEGRYANFFKVGHNAYEVIVDFGQYYPENEDAVIYDRIIMGPGYAKAFLNTLKESLEQYERTFGKIAEIDES